MTFLLNLRNTVAETRIVDITVCARAAYYHGMSGEEESKTKEKIEVPGNGGEIIISAIILFIVVVL